MDGRCLDVVSPIAAAADVAHLAAEVVVLLSLTLPRLQASFSLLSTTRLRQTPGLCSVER